MYTRKIYEPESKFSLQIARNPGASVRSGSKGTGESIERSSAKWTIDTSGEEEIQQRRKNGSGQLSQISPYKAKESVLDEDIQNLFRVDTGILEHHVKNYVSDYSRWYSESMQEIGNMGWSERYSSSDSLDKGAADFSDRSEIIRMYLDVNKDKLNPEYYTAVTDFLTQQKDCTAELQENHKQKRSLLTRFDDQESYDAFLSELAERERLLRLDTEELQREIDQRESDLEEYEVYRDQYVIASNNPDAFSQEDYERIMSGYNALKSKYGSPESMQSDTERLRYEHSTAVRLQNRVLLPGEAMKAPDYEELSEYLPVGVPLPEDTSATYFYNLINGRISDPGPMAPKGKNLLSDYDKLTPDEIAVFNYNYNSGNAEAAMDYLLSLEETLNYRKAEAAFSDYEGRTGKEILYGVDAGLEQYSSGMRGMKDMLFGGDGDYIATEKEYLSGMIRNDLADNGFALPKRMGGASLGQAAYDTVTMTTNELPSVLTAALAEMVVPGSGVILDKAMTFSTSGGNAYIEARRMGFGETQASGYAALVGVSETCLGHLLGGINNLSGKASRKVLEKVLPGVDNSLAKIAQEYGGNIIADGNEEYLQTVLEPAFKKIALNIDANVDWEEATYAWFLGALSSAGAEGTEILSRFAGKHGVKDLKNLREALLNYIPASLEEYGNASTKELEEKNAEPQPQPSGDVLYFTTDTWTGELEEIWTEEDATDTTSTLDPNVGQVTTKETSLENVEQAISELALKLQATGMTPGRAAIAAQEMYSEAEKRFGNDMGAVLESYKPGQDPGQFLDGFQNAYILGKQGASHALSESKAAAYLTREQRENAYYLGSRLRY